MLQRTARIVPAWSAVFLIIMAVLINSPALFYMATAMVATILACRIQAWLAVRGIHLERIAPSAVHTGELVTVSTMVRSEHRTIRPLIRVEDVLPDRLVVVDRTPSLPVAPSFDQPIQTRYSFRPLQRGRFRWRNVQLIGTDALGLVTKTRVIKTEVTELTVYPAKISVHLGLRPVGGDAGVIEQDGGKFRGSGLEPRGIREYAEGDSIRTVDWRASARTQRIMVKEFEAGSNLSAAFVLQRTKGSEFGKGLTSLEVMCGHCCFLSEQFLRLGCVVSLPNLSLNQPAGHAVDSQMREIEEALTDLVADRSETISQDFAQTMTQRGVGGSIYLMVALQDPQLPGTIAKYRGQDIVCLLYNPRDYDPKAQSSLTASNEDYTRALRQAGAKIHLMPKVVNLP
jgi:uncharacterized protein (DUF58 family)